MLKTDWVDDVDYFTAADANAVASSVNALSGVATKTTNYTLGVSDRVIFANAQGASFTVTLPAAAANIGRQYTVKKVDLTVNTVAIVTTSSQTIDGMPSALLVFPGHRVTLVSDGANWHTTESNYLGTQLGYAELDVYTSTINSSVSDSSLIANKILGLSITTIGIGRPVKVSFQGQAYNTVVNDFCAVQLLTNNSAARGGGAVTSNPQTNLYQTLAFDAHPMLTLGTSYTFEVGMWCQSSSQAIYYADGTTPLPMTLSVAGQ